MQYEDRWTCTPLVTVLCALLLACGPVGAGAQTPGQIPTDRAPVVVEAAAEEAAETGMTLVCEVYCSDTELRSAVARLRWKLVPGPALEEAGAAGLAAAPQRLETTVFKDGFAKDLYVSLPLFQEGEQALVPSSDVMARRQDTMRAFQLRLGEVGGTATPQGFTSGEAEMSAVVENLEPGMTYTWRLVMDTAADGMASPTVTCQAPVCPADMMRGEEGPQ